MSSAQLKFDDLLVFFCVVSLNNKNINARIARELSGFTFTSGEVKVFNTALEKPSCGIEISRSL